jgi:hypothetical protein
MTWRAVTSRHVSFLVYSNSAWYYCTHVSSISPISPRSTTLVYDKNLILQLKEGEEIPHEQMIGTMGSRIQLQYIYCLWPVLTHPHSFRPTTYLLLLFIIRYRQLPSVLNIYHSFSTFTTCFWHLPSVFDICDWFSTFTTCFRHLSTVFDICDWFSTFTTCFRHLPTVFDVYDSLSTFTICFRQLPSILNIYHPFSTVTIRFRHLWLVFDVYNSFSGFTICFWQLPSVLNIYHSFSMFTTHLRHLPSVFDVYDSFSTFTTRFRRLPLVPPHPPPHPSIRAPYICMITLTRATWQMHHHPPGPRSTTFRTLFM